MASLRQIRIRPVNRHPVMHGHVARLHDRSDFAVEVICREVVDPL